MAVYLYSRAFRPIKEIQVVIEVNLRYKLDRVYCGNDIKYLTAFLSLSSVDRIRREFRRRDFYPEIRTNPVPAGYFWRFKTPRPLTISEESLEVD